MMPSIYLYQKKSYRKYVLIYNSFLILLSMFYLTIMTWENNYPTVFLIDSTKKFDILYRRPYGPVGFYSLGILLSIFYFEYQLALSNRSMRDRYSYRVLNFF